MLEFWRHGEEEELKYYVPSKATGREIHDFPRNDEFPKTHFFFVRVSEASVGPNCVDIVKTRWGVLARYHRLPMPAVFDVVRGTLAAKRCSWLCDFCLRRVIRALAISQGIPVDTSSSDIDMKRPSF
ncbi:unnamed protein product [Arabis nemorensis]|uniref:Uncharacterized protein n=1 Tax=Arabis nemorensis TaxID=586526 RepID=A0A565BIV6_9BRAS|nr:unnamed protein product [Arabis nemorensis]